MNILVINCGSSSLKYQLIDISNEDVLAKGLVERIGIQGSSLTQKYPKYPNKEKYCINQPMKSHKEAIELVLKSLIDKDYGVIKDMNEISAIGHRVVHGGEKYEKSVLIDDEVIKNISDLSSLAPLHNPPNLIGINVCKDLMPNTPMVAVFDTAFHQTMPEKAFLYPIDYNMYKKYGIRRYGFHGTSHKYVSQRAAAMLNKKNDNLKIITCHLGNGASITAVKNGKSVDTSMGFTPLEGIAMGTRCGNIDPSIVTFLIQAKKWDCKRVDSFLNKECGILGISGISSDYRDVRDASENGNEQAKLAIDIFNYRIKMFIGSYFAILNGADALVFTAGIGENSSTIRKDVCDNMDYLGIKIDDKKNNDAVGVEKIISSDDSKVKVLVIPTNEELMIAYDTKEIAFS